MIMDKVMNLGKGKLTYTMGIVAIIYAIVSLVLGNGDQDTNFVILWTGLTTLGVRRAIK